MIQIRSVLKRVPLAREVYYRMYRARIRAQCREEDARNPPEGATPPALLRFRIGGSVSVPDFLEVGRATAENIELALRVIGRSTAAYQRILDFGCGCGRTLRWTLEQNPKTRFAAGDVDAEAVTWCRRHLPGPRYEVIQTAPPTPFGDESFDLIYAVSVFTRMDAPAQIAWLKEFRRLLEPGGLALVTVHGEKTWTGTPVEAQVRERGFLCEASEKLAGILPDWYQTAYHSEEWIRREFQPYLNVRVYVEERMGLQDVVLLQRQR